jgi:Reverse transcriptase (RNA-dependent DNA polymerase)
MPSGSTKAPSTFQKFVLHVLGNYLGQGVDVYLDDILIQSKTTEEHQPLLNRVLNQLKEKSLLVNETRYVLNTYQVEFLGESFCVQRISISLKQIASPAQLSSPQV